MRCAAIILPVVLFLGGCSEIVQEVKPWEKDLLAKKMMRPDGGNALFYGYRKHIYYSKEGSKGGGGVGGGGCGCN